MTLLVTISVLFCTLLLFYAILLFKYNKLFTRLTERSALQGTVDKISVIIPARNEEKNIGNCIRALKEQTGLITAPEIIVVDDHSDDATASIASSLGATVISLQQENTGVTNAFKKMAVTTGIRYAKGSIIFTTDADCTVPKQWIMILSDLFRQPDVMMVTGPVRMVPENSLLSKFQSLDFAILQGITAASVHSGFHDMASAANLGYRKQAFLDVNGYEGIDDIATGDDMLLMQKISSRFPGSIRYAFNRNAIVDTKTEPTWKAFFRQRIRWSSKATRYKDKKIFRILLQVYLLNLCMVYFLVTALFSPLHFIFCLAAFMLKTMVEWNFTDHVLRFFSLSPLINLFPLFQPLHVIYTVLSGTFGQFGKVEWKGRKVK